MKNMIRWLRKLFRFPHPELSRAQLAALYDAALDLNYRFSCDLKRAVLHGYWRFDHPLSAVFPEQHKSRHPRMTEAEIANQYQKIIAGEYKLLVAESVKCVLELPQ